VTSKVETAVAKRDEELAGLTRLVDHYSTDFARVLPAHIGAETFVRLAQGLLRRNTDLAAAAKANPSSLLAALLECAELGHRPGSDQYALTSRRVKPRKDAAAVPTIVGIEQYQGVIERMYRAGAVLSVKCEVVRQRDHFDWKPTRMVVPEHEYNARDTAEARGPLDAVYAYAEMQGGATSRVVVMAADEVDRHKALAGTTKFWDDWPDSMWRKTAMHELEKWVPTSSEYLQERARAMAAAQRSTIPPPPADDLPPPVTVEGTVVVEQPAAPEQPAPPVEWPEPAKPGEGAQR
jgi:recombination protein RecT